MGRDYEQVALDCAVLRQAVTDLRAWRRPFPVLKKADAKVAPQSVGEREWPGSETLLAFGDAARWMFDCARQGECHFSFQAVCSRLGIDAWTVRGAIREKLTPHQQAWITAMGIERGKLRGRA